MSDTGNLRYRRSNAGWGTRAVLVLAILAQLVACQALLAPAGAGPAVMVQDVGHGIGHDAVCEASAVLTTVGTARAGVLECLPLAEAALALVALATTGLLVAWTAAGGAPPWAPRRLVPGRRRLLAVGITRV
ncbi:hypothetical protein I4I73_06595 [Pseudonocardia sp. KRD-184]|uniref:Uncharacterized protein n=1 Tax=Pseudonocardia oceani TaxID=2792013 RepID=A0ABS6U2W6_9PSEU|nr:hypothetical protein [Pseudonocardia oceani]MBW0088729.1 hypothetical protein [Pseudonocardia oceani]MBW0095668.1 hypothetical protein [Pseudonocardia oceani]MBW0121853.1 hypothetical protein [Pseudonocardia oceani]MBW0126591.1 hypothetical protein [Pseudonocardia oceani]